MLVTPYRYTPLGFASTAVGTAAGTLTLPSGVTADRVRQTLIYCGGAINYRDDGTSPATGTSGTVGIPVSGGSYITYDSFADKFKAIAQVGTVTLSISFYG